MTWCFAACFHFSRPSPWPSLLHPRCCIPSPSHCSAETHHRRPHNLIQAGARSHRPGYDIFWPTTPTQAPIPVCLPAAGSWPSEVPARAMTVPLMYPTGTASAQIRPQRQWLPCGGLRGRGFIPQAPIVRPPIRHDACSYRASQGRETAPRLADVAPGCSAPVHFLTVSGVRHDAAFLGLAVCTTVIWVKAAASCLIACGHWEWGMA